MATSVLAPGLRLTTCGLALSMVLSVGPAAAQISNAGGGGSGLFGSGGQSLFGSQLNSGFGSAAGQSGQLGGFGSNALTLNQQTGQNGGFVGRTGDDTAAVFEALNQSGNEFLNRFERTMNSRNRGRGQNQASDARPPIRVTLSLGFRPPKAPARNLPGPTADRLNGLLSEKGFSAAATIIDGVALLTGKVADDAERRMLESLAKLEPGVERVDSRLTVQGELLELPPPSPSPSARGN